jgi:hypothetical protein
MINLVLPLRAFVQVGERVRGEMVWGRADWIVHLLVTMENVTSIQIHAHAHTHTHHSPTTEDFKYEENVHSIVPSHARYLFASVSAAASANLPPGFAYVDADIPCRGNGPGRYSLPCQKKTRLAGMAFGPRRGCKGQCEWSREARAVRR